MSPKIRRLRRLRACAALHGYGPAALLWLLDDLDKHIQMDGLIDARLQKFVADGGRQLLPPLKIIARGNPENDF